MKKLPLILLVLIVVLLIAGIVFLATFDANRYKNEIASRLSERTGYPVKIGSLALGFRNGIAFQVNDFSLEGKLKTGPGVFSFVAKRFFLKLDPSYLLKKELRASEILLESPQLTYLNDVGQTPDVPSQNPIPPLDSKTNPVNQTVPVKPSASLMTQLEIAKMILTDGTFIYGDKTRRTSLAFSVQNIHLEINHLSLKAPVQFSGTADLLLGTPKKFKIDGTFSYPEQTIHLNAELESSVKLIGQATQIFGVPALRLDVGIQNLDLSSFYSPEQQAQEYFAGSMSGNVSLSASGGASNDLVRSLSGAGEFEIKSGALKNKNILRENLEKITQIPGVNLLFQVDLGPKFKNLLEQRDTNFDLMQLKFGVQEWRVNIQSLILQASDYSVSFAGFYLLDQSIDLNGSLVIGPLLSQAMTGKVHEFAWISDREGQILIPFIMRGKFPGAAIAPNLGTIAQKTIETVGAEVLSQALDSLLKPKKKE